MECETFVTKGGREFILWCWLLSPITPAKVRIKGGRTRVAKYFFVMLYVCTLKVVSSVNYESGLKWRFFKRNLVHFLKGTFYL